MRIFLTTLILCALLGLGASPAPAEGLGLKIATVAPEGTALTEALRQASDDISSRTDGRVFLKIYSGGVMGSDETVLRKMALGQLHGAILASSALANRSELHMVMNMPLLFHSGEEVDAVRAEVDELLAQDLGQSGLVSMGIIELGFVYLMSNSPIRTMDDLRGRKPWVPEFHELGQELFSEIGVAPIPLPLSDVLTGLQTGLVDTVANAPVATLALQWFTRIRYLTTVPLFYSYGSLVFQDKAWKGLSPEDQEVVRQVLGEMSADLNTRSRTDNEAALETLKKQGIEFLDVRDEDLATLQGLADEVTDRWRDQGKLDTQLLDRVRAMVEAVRSR